MNCIIRLSCLLLSASLASPSSGTDTITFDQITPERIGEFVTVTGKVSGFFPPPEPRAPYAFSLADKANKEMRVVAWPDIYERVDRRDLLQTTGTLVTLTAEVAEYKEKLELHLQDWEEIEVGTSETATLATVAGDRKTTE